MTGICSLRICANSHLRANSQNAFESARIHKMLSKPVSPAGWQSFVAFESAHIHIFARIHRMLSNLRAFAQIRKLKMLSNLRRDVNSQNAFESSQNLHRTRIHKMLSNLRESAQIHISAHIRKHFELSNLREFTRLFCKATQH